MMGGINTMIEFSGELTGEARKFFYKKTVGTAVCLMLVVSVISTIVMLIAWYLFFGIFEFLNVLACLCFIVIFSLLPCPMFFSKKMIPQKVTVKGKSLSSKTGFRTKIIPKNEVKKVYDYGKYYYIASSFYTYSTIFVCQKDLLTKGTLEDFEALFKSKIIRV